MLFFIYFRKHKYLIFNTSKTGQLDLSKFNIYRFILTFRVGIIFIFSLLQEHYRKNLLNIVDTLPKKMFESSMALFWSSPKNEDTKNYYPYNKDINF